MKILITGATGYIGRRVVQRLTQCGDIELLSVVRDVRKASELLYYRQCKHVPAEEMTEAIVSFQPELVLHLATLSTSRNDYEIIKPMIDANILFGAELLNAVCNAASVKMFVNVGSFAEFRNGVERGYNDAYLYTATKSAFRHILDYYSQLCGFKYVTAVPYTVYGGNDTARKLMDYMIDSIGAEQPVKMSPGEQILDFVHVDDVVRFFADTVPDSSQWNRFGSGNNVYLGTGVGTKVRDLAVMISRQLDTALNIEWGGLDYRPLDVMYAVALVDNNTSLCDWKAQVSLEQGIERHLQFKGLK